MSSTGGLLPTRVTRFWWLIPILAFLSLASWSVASPVGATPDEDFHLASIWCGLGERAGICEAAPKDGAERAGWRKVPEDLLGPSSKCFASKPDVSADCQRNGYGVGSPLAATDRGNFSGHLYPPVFYAVMSVFVTPSVDTSVVLMRLFNSLLFVGLMTSLWCLLPRSRRRTLVWAAAVTTVPLGIFLVASINPSGWAVLSAATLWLALLGFYESEGRQRWGLGAVAVLSAVIGAGARSDGAVFAVIAVGVAMLLAFRRDRRFMIASILPVVLVVFAAIMYKLGSQSGASTTGLSATTPPTADVIRELVYRDLPNIAQLWIGPFGLSNLGWLDTEIPASVWVAGFALFAISIAVGLTSRSPRKLIALLTVTVAAVVFPLVLLVQTGVMVGSYFQPRYLLPLLVMVAGISLFEVRAPMSSPSRFHIGVAIAILSSGNAISLYANLRRYITGTDVVALNLNANVEWWWAGAPGPMFLWAAAVALYTATMIGIAVPLWNRAVALTERDVPRPSVPAA